MCPQHQASGTSERVSPSPVPLRRESSVKAPVWSLGLRHEGRTQTWSHRNKPSQDVRSITFLPLGAAKRSCLKCLLSSLNLAHICGVKY